MFTQSSLVGATDDVLSFELPFCQFCPIFAELRMGVLNMTCSRQVTGRHGSKSFASLCRIGLLVVLVSPFIANGTASAASKASGEDPLTVDRLVNEAYAFGRAHPTTFGGVWVDTAERVHVQVVGSSSALVLPVLHAMSDPSNVVVDSADFTIAQITAVRERIAADMPVLRNEGIHVWAVAEKTDQNKVLVTVDPSDPPSSIAALQKLYPAGMLMFDRFRPIQTASRYQKAPPWLGGMQINGPALGAPGFAALCTTGFNLLDQGIYVVSTASHCFPFLAVVDHGRKSGQVGGQKINQITGSGAFPGSTADVEFTPAPQQNGAPGQMIESQGSPTIHVVGELTSQVVGPGVCKSGITTDITCQWFISAIHQTITYADSGLTFNDQVVATNVNLAAALPGDSGGPVWIPDSNGSAVAAGWQSGIFVTTSGQPVGMMIFSFIADALLQLQVSLVMG